MLSDRDKFDCIALYCALYAPNPCPYRDHLQTERHQQPDRPNPTIQIHHLRGHSRAILPDLYCRFDAILSCR